MTGQVEDSSMFKPTTEEFREAHARARERMVIRVEGKLPDIDHDQTVARALHVLTVEKEQIVYAHWKGRLWRRYHRRVEAMVERRLSRPFSFDSISGHAVRARWLAVLGRFVRRDVERRFGVGQAVSLADVQRAYHDEHPAT